MSGALTVPPRKKPQDGTAGALRGPVCVVGGVRVACRQMDATIVGLVAAGALSWAATLIPYREMKAIGGVCLLLILLATLSQAIELALR